VRRSDILSGIAGWLGRLGIRGKLIGIFVLIKVMPLLLLAWFSWLAAKQLGVDVSEAAGTMVDSMLSTVGTVGQKVTEDSIRALDERSREAIEAMTTRTAREIADFLHDRDSDILAAGAIPPDEAAYRRFVDGKRRLLHRPGRWHLAADGQSWQPESPHVAESGATRPILPDNARDFHTRPPEYLGEPELRPLYAEMTFVDLNGDERIKVTRGNLTEKRLAHVADRRQTFIHAETYFAKLAALQPGEIYVSEVIGAYVPTDFFGPYLPAKAKEHGKAFAPEKSAYAGAENPVGKRFRGIVRWATPVLKDGRKVGYVTLALDHDHIREFTDHLLPTGARYSPIADASQGNYAFLWDHKSRAISHPRDYFIVGYDPQTGLPATPWMDEALYAEWQASGKPAHEFLAGIPPFRDQNLKRRPARALVQAGTVGLDCRYLNFSPQCDGWQALTEHGGSGSFVIYFSGLWKLTTAAAIPYFTGQYGQSPQGFGFVTIGANVDDFHRAATQTAGQIESLITERQGIHREQRGNLMRHIREHLRQTGWALWLSTALMIVIVIAIAIWMAGALTRRITAMIDGLRTFERGNLDHRLDASGSDEMAELARSFNRMADSIAASLRRADEARVRAEDASRMKSEYMATMSQELRDPIDGILGLSRRLQTEIDDPAQQASTQAIHDSGRQLLDRVNEILEHLDIREEAIARLESMAHHDPLTGLPNRLLISDRLSQAIFRAERQGRKVAVCFIDLDGFKEVNDRFGHDTGDILLAVLGQRLSVHLRASDTVGRLGGDEFVVLLEEIDDDAAALHLAQGILRQIGEPIEASGNDCRIGASIGVALYPDHGRDTPTLLRQADSAMYEAKRAGKNQVRLSTAE